MDPVIFSIITFLTIVVGVWLSLGAVIVGRIIQKAKATKGYIRRNDIICFALSVCGAISIFVVVFIYPGFILSIPSTVAFIEISLIPVMWHFSEKFWKQLKLMK